MRTPDGGWRADTAPKGLTLDQWFEWRRGQDEAMQAATEDIIRMQAERVQAIADRACLTNDQLH